MQICATATAFQGLEARRIEVQVQMTGGTPAIVVVGLGDKAVSEARERVRAAFASIGLAIPPGRLIVNLAPADMPKEGTHYDLPIALAMMAAIGALPHDALDGVVCFGEVGLDGSLASAPARCRRRWRRTAWARRSCVRKCAVQKPHGRAAK
jgi:magnesium chelatase family protein